MGRVYKWMGLSIGTIINQQSDEEKRALQTLSSALGPCLPQGQQIQLQPSLLRLWLGEALWHAANNSAPAPTQAPQEAG